MGVSPSTSSWVYTHDKASPRTCVNRPGFDRLIGVDMSTVPTEPVGPPPVGSPEPHGLVYRNITSIPDVWRNYALPGVSADEVAEGPKPELTV